MLWVIDLNREYKRHKKICFQVLRFNPFIRNELFRVDFGLGTFLIDKAVGKSCGSMIKLFSNKHFGARI